jgi:hypothetical protein
MRSVLSASERERERERDYEGYHKKVMDNWILYDLS